MLIRKMLRASLRVPRAGGGRSEEGGAVACLDCFQSYDAAIGGYVMLKIDRQKHLFTRLENPSLADVSISERYHLQEYICNSPEAFFDEIGQALFLIDKEVQPSDDVDDRIDLLALDKEGQAVIIELKRSNHKWQMLQAISYAGMIGRWQPEEFLAQVSRLGNDRVDQLHEFLEVGEEEINRHQRIILVAEAFDYSVLIGAEWLSEQFGVDIICCRLSLATESGTSAEYLVCSNIFPTPELALLARRRGRGNRGIGGKVVMWPDWDTALADVTNPDVVAYFNQEIKAGREDYLQRRVIHYRDKDKKRRWWIGARPRFAYVGQDCRFDGDIDFWRAGLSHPESIKPVGHDNCIRLHLYTGQDFLFFHQAVTQKLVGMKWTATYRGPSEPDAEGES
jgi:hypothetical protein